ncbi:methionine/alanine import family NSS transporter small subunit [Streptomyces armeniacus]|uniref:Methionine/alanine import family NSS transporter small subunit n=1 Tax=Streptomyces armeniacus TaxID=83291 RepID=A0A345XMD4_9ACTN|nr:methionine/alanine import family NSS transporter small subunit [Streptomyces armeniacus]AXK32800.1 methionine/alanine import family NSS transporter small subunit [Streptomyces armeniacus]
MSASALIMMIVAIVIVWGGMTAAIMKLRGHPDPPDDDSPAERA